MTEKDILDLIKKDELMTDALVVAKSLNLPDWWIGAGFVRAKVWDHLHGYTTRTAIPDVDVIYFDKNDFSDSEIENDSTAKEIFYQNKLNEIFPGPKWSVTNQARMHVYHETAPYNNSVEGLADWIESATCVAVKIDERGNLVLAAPHGISDLVNLILRPTYNTERNLKEFDGRMKEKDWTIKWPKLKIVRL